MIRTSHDAPDTTARPNQWRSQALCATPQYRRHANLWFPNPTDTEAEAAAKRVCAACPAVDACLTFALNNNIGEGIYGGLTDNDRSNLRRTARRNNLSAQDTAQRANTARQATNKPRTLRNLFDENTERLTTGHLAWIGRQHIELQGRTYSPRQMAFILDRGREPVGRVLTTCGVKECVLAVHIGDNDERMSCGTRPGYSRHLREQTEICDRCRAANAAANRRLQTTGSTKATA
jgi:hypothetical protein